MLSLPSPLQPQPDLTRDKAVEDIRKVCEYMSAYSEEHMLHIDLMWRKSHAVCLGVMALAAVILSGKAVQCELSIVYGRRSTRTYI